MKTTGRIEENHNTLIVSLEGDQSYVKILDADGELIRLSQSPETTELQQIASPGDYVVETDGTVTAVSSAQIDMQVEEDPI